MQTLSSQDQNLKQMLQDYRTNVQDLSDHLAVFEHKCKEQDQVLAEADMKLNEVMN